MTPEDTQEISIIERADAVAEQLDADVLFYNGNLDRPVCLKLISAVSERNRRPNAILLLVTPGGSPDVAFRMARCLQTQYQQFHLYVSGFCKSAGTLVAIGAHELVFDDHGELGPLDVQMSKKDELWDMQSGLTVTAALSTLQSRAYLAFERFFLQIEGGSGGAIKVKTAADIATQLVTGIYAPLIRQIDPLHVGEAARAVQIADHYGQILLEVGANTNCEGLDHIISGYPSHGFVIDREEARKLFDNVRAPTHEESVLAKSLGEHARAPITLSKMDEVMFLSTEISLPDGLGLDLNEGKTPENEKTDTSTGTGPDGVAPQSREEYAGDGTQDDPGTTNEARPSGGDGGRTHKAVSQNSCG